MLSSCVEEISWHWREGSGGFVVAQGGLLLLTGLRDLARLAARIVLMISLLMPGQYTACLTRRLVVSVPQYNRVSDPRRDGEELQERQHGHRTEWGLHRRRGPHVPLLGTGRQENCISHHKIFYLTFLHAREGHIRESILYQFPFGQQISLYLHLPYYVISKGIRRVRYTSQWLHYIY